MKTEAKQLIDYKVGDKFEGSLLVKNIEIKEARNGTHYLALELSDKSSDVTGRKWDAVGNELENFPAGTVVHVRGEIGEYNGVKQITANLIRPLPVNHPESDVNLYIKTAPLETKVMMDIIKEKIDEIEDDIVKKIVRRILNQHYKSFMTHAAAKSNHHAFSGGLAYHTVSMLKIAEHIVSFYPDVNKSLLYGGILIHDIGKTDELDDVVSGSGYTMKGQLLGHIALMDSEIVQTAIEEGIDPDHETVILLRHLVLSHHGKLEWGSPVLPQTREAQALHHIDMLDARMNMTEGALEGVEAGDFSPKVWALGTPIYKETE